MENTDLLLLLLLCGGILSLILGGIVKYLMDHFADIKYVKMEISRAGNWDEYAYWMRELSALRWSIIPGLTPDKVKRIKKRFYRGKYAKKREKSDGFISLLMPSILGICICAVCLAGGTFAWFNASQEVQTQTIKMANYTVNASVLDANGAVAGTGDTVQLGKGTYTVTLTADGNATTGYCFVEIGDTKKPTQQFPSEDSITFTLVMNETATVEFSPRWGTSSADATERIWNGGTHTYGTATVAEDDSSAGEKGEATEPPADTTEDTTTEETTTTETEPTLDPTQYTVQTGDSLGKIADLYGVSVERLQAYNNIENPSLIYRGQVIKIPPADWKIPETTTEVTTPATTGPTETQPQTEATTEPTGEATGATTGTTVPEDAATEGNPSESDGNE